MDNKDVSVENYFSAERLREQGLKSADKALETIVGLLGSKHENVRLEAAREILRVVSIDSKKSLR